MSNNPLVDQSEKFKKRIASKNTKTYRVVYKNEIVVGFPIDEGVLGFQTKYSAGIVSPAYNIWKLKELREVHIPYLERYLRSPQARAMYASRMQGAVARRRSLKKSDFLRLKIPFPQLNNQIRIATLLSRTEELITKRKESIRLLDELLKSTFLEMFGDPVLNPKKWEKIPLNKLGTLDRGVSKHRPRNAPELLGGPYPLIQTGDVANAGLYIKIFSQTYSEKGLGQSKMWPKGTLCITIAANIAKTSILSFESCFPDSVVGFTSFPKESHPIFVHYLFKFFQRILEKNAPQAAQKNINLGILRSLPVPKPPLPLQEKFVEIVNKTETLRNKYETSLQELENLYGSLAQRAFRGELDVSKVPIHHELMVDDVVHVQEVDSPTIVIEKGGKFELNIKSIQKLISGNFTKPFTFAMLWEQINTMLLDQEADEEKETPAEGEELHNYETVQQLIYTMLNGSNPFLKQTFSQGGEQKEVVLELAR